MSNAESKFVFELLQPKYTPARYCIKQRDLLSTALDADDVAGEYTSIHNDLAAGLLELDKCMRSGLKDADTTLAHQMRHLIKFNNQSIYWPLVTMMALCDRMQFAAASTERAQDMAVAKDTFVIEKPPPDFGKPNESPDTQGEVYTWAFDWMTIYNKFHDLANPLLAATSERLQNASNVFHRAEHVPDLDGDVNMLPDNGTSPSRTRLTLDAATESIKRHVSSLETEKRYGRIKQNFLLAALSIISLHRVRATRYLSRLEPVLTLLHQVTREIAEQLVDDGEGAVLVRGGAHMGALNDQLMKTLQSVSCH